MMDKWLGLPQWKNIPCLQYVEGQALRWPYGTVSFQRTIQSDSSTQHASIRLTNVIPAAILKSFPLPLALPVLCFTCKFKN
jgi:hypothetical protein